MNVTFGVPMQILNYGEKLGLGKSHYEARKHSTQFEFVQGLPLMYMKTGITYKNNNSNNKKTHQFDLKEKQQRDVLTR